MWNGRWAGPAGATVACDVTWDYYGISKLSDLTIYSITKRRAAQEMLTPAGAGAREVERKAAITNQMAG
eukprot:131372-Prymnesium_polylepis.1